jgi:class 3 adenylate cyclase
VANIDWRRWLLKVRAPTLVLVSTAFSRNEASEIRWSDIADVRLRPIDMPRERALYQTDEARVAIDDFLDGGAGGAQPDVARPARDASSGTAVILFADIADSTALTERIGDAAFRERARALETALRSAITDAGGTAVEGKLLGDGVLAVFDSARAAIDGALRCAEAGDGRGLPLHLGVHAGDVIRDRGNIYGGAVNIAARVSDAAAPGEVLVSDIVRGLARTSAGMSFDDRGDHNLKGIADPVRLYAVRPHGG